MNLLLITPFIFLVIAFFFSMLGMGGSQLYIPILFWLGMDFKTEAIPLGMLLNLLTSSSSAFTYIKNRLIKWRIAFPLALTMVIFAPLGAIVNVKLPSRWIILIFAIFTAFAGTLMIFGIQPKRKISSKTEYLLGISVGAGLGFLAGLIGRGGGSFLVPILYLSGLGPKFCAGTSSFVVSFSILSSLISHLSLSAHPQWKIWLATSLAVLIGSQLGSRTMVKKLKPAQIKIIFALILYLVALILLVKDVILK